MNSDLEHHFLSHYNAYENVILPTVYRSFDNYKQRKWGSICLGIFFVLDQIGIMKGIKGELKAQVEEIEIMVHILIGVMSS